MIKKHNILPETRGNHLEKEFGYTAQQHWKSIGYHYMILKAFFVFVAGTIYIFVICSISQAILFSGFPGQLIISLDK